MEAVDWVPTKQEAKLQRVCLDIQYRYPFAMLGVPRFNHSLELAEYLFEICSETLKPVATKGAVLCLIAFAGHMVEVNPAMLEEIIELLLQLFQTFGTLPKLE